MQIRVGVSHGGRVLWLVTKNTPRYSSPCCDLAGLTRTAGARIRPRPSPSTFQEKNIHVRTYVRAYSLRSTRAAVHSGFLALGRLPRRDGRLHGGGGGGGGGGGEGGFYTHGVRRVRPDARPSPRKEDVQEGTKKKMEGRVSKKRSGSLLRIRFLLRLRRFLLDVGFVVVMARACMRA